MLLPGGKDEGVARPDWERIGRPGTRVELDPGHKHAFLKAGDDKAPDTLTGQEPATSTKIEG